MTVQKCGERARHCPMAGFVCNRASGTQDKVKWNLRHCPRGQRKMHPAARAVAQRSEEHTSELQSPYDLVCRLLLEKKKKKKQIIHKEKKKQVKGRHRLKFHIK